jgi:hypothetical protein
MIKENKVVSMQERLKLDAFDAIEDLFYFADEYYGEYLLELADDFSELVTAKEEVISSMIPHLLSWAVLCHRVRGGSRTIFQHYLDSPEYKSRKRTKVHQILNEWKYAIPGFYFVEEIAGERVLIISDLFQIKEKLVAVYNEIYHQPKEGDLILGFLLPAGDGSYSPVIDFLHIPASLKRDTAFMLLEYYHRKTVVRDHEFFVKHYPRLLALISQILSKPY